ncbi:hypothetical protein [Endozoicomonas sp. OPT23]|uniref:hypothetical protein n=1 Tax=Endozoicomonas sp. OPT23 TaxID=2072845 RepID=UPI00129C0040|nr:hypothetical protein [Endozoicomonas sp. OPT23]
MARLDKSWSGFMAGLEQAKESLVNPKYFPPESTDRNLAEGYRYMLGHISRMIELEMRQDPEFPEFHRAVDMLRKWTAENPDTMYISAALDADAYYRVTGQAANTLEWKTSERGVVGPKAPRLVTFQTTTDYPGRTGDLKEMALCNSQTLDFANSFSLQLDKDNRFEILIGPERPKDYQGNFILSQKEMLCPATGKTELRKATGLTVRKIFSDWENEKTLELDIVRLDKEGHSRPPITSEFVSQKLDKIAKELPNQIRFWNYLQEYAMELRADVNGDGVRPMPVNDINQPALPFTAGGAAGAKQYYAAGKFELKEDEALVIKVTAPVEPHYVGFQLGTLWFEGPDQQNYVSSLSGHQLPVSSDGSRYYIVAAKDPGYQGWVSTTGLLEGTHSMRFVFRNDTEKKQLPETSAFLVNLEDIETFLPSDTPKITTKQRAEEIAVRQKHIKYRWRGY